MVYDSRKVEEGSLFICIRGAVVDGHKFVPDVVAKGAKVLIVEEAVEAPEDVTVILVKDTRYAMAFISAAYFGYPAEKLKTIGITGNRHIRFIRFMEIKHYFIIHLIDMVTG